MPAGRLKALARHAATSWAAVIARMPSDRRVATLLAFARAFEATALDDALDLLDLIITDLLAQAKLAGEKERLRTLGDLDTAALQLRDVCTVLLDDACSSARVRSLAFARVPRPQLAEAVALVERLARPPEDDYQGELLDRYRRVRRFWPCLLRTVTFQGTQAGRPLMHALSVLAAWEDQREPDLSQAPLDVVSRAWRRFVIGPDRTIDRRAYTLCVLQRLQDGLRRRDVFVDRSERWGDPRAKLLQGTEWEAARSQVCLSLGRQATAATELESLRRQLDDAYRRTADNLPANEAVRIETVAGRDALTLTPLDKLDEPASLRTLRQAVAGLLPRVDLPDVLLEIQARTNFAGAFTHVSEAAARVTDLAISVCAVLLAEACNIGLEPLTRPDVPALTRGRLAWVQQNYIRAETLIRANALLVDAQTGVPLAGAWGGGEVASADGLRFVVPVRTVNAGPNSKYFGAGRGITYYNFTSDQFTGFHGIVIPGTLRDSLFILEGLLEQQTSLRPLEIMTDTAGASDVVFGLFWLLGYQFSPRLADIGEARFWRHGPRRRLWRAERPGAAPGQHRADRAELGRPAAGGRIVDAGDHQRLGVDRLAAAEQPPLDPDAGDRRAGAGGQDALPAGLPRRRGLPPAHPHAVEPRREPPRRGAGDLPRPARRGPPALPRGPGGPARGAGAGGQRGGALEHPVHGRGAGPSASPGRRDEARGRRPPLPLGAREHQLPGEILIRVVGVRRSRRVATAARSGGDGRCGRADAA